MVLSPDNTEGSTEKAEPSNSRSGPEPSAPTGLGTFDSLRIGNFRILLFVATLTNAAEWVQQVSLSWLVYEWTGSGAALGSLNLVRSMSSLALTPVAGVTIDRMNKRTMMLVIAAALTVISIVLAGFLLAGYEALWMLFAFTAVGGIIGAFDNPLRNTVVFYLVPRSFVSNAIGLVQTGWGLTRSIGPAIGGFMIVWIGAGGNFLVEAIVYAIVFAGVLRLVFPPLPPAGPRAPFFTTLREGLVFAMKSKLTRTFLLMGWIMPLFIIPSFVALPPIFAKEVFNGGAGEMGLLLSSIGIGGIFGGLVAASLGAVDRRGLVQIASLLGTAISLVAFSLCPSVWLAMIAFAFAGFFEMIFLTGNETLLQLSIPDHLRGRVTSITALRMLLSPLGAMNAGLGADLIGPREIMLTISLIAAALAVFTFVFSPTVRNYRTSEAIRAQG